MGIMSVLYLALHLLQPEKLLTVHLVQPVRTEKARSAAAGMRRHVSGWRDHSLRVDVRDSVLEAGNDDVLESVDAAVCHLDHLVQDDERRLRGREGVSDQAKVMAPERQSLTCNEANSTNVSTALAKVSLHFFICCPPRPSPVKPKPARKHQLVSSLALDATWQDGYHLLPPSVSDLSGSNVGRIVPDTFSCFVCTLKVAAEIDS